MQGKLKLCVWGGGGGVAFVFRLPAGQVEFSGLFLTLSGPTVLYALMAIKAHMKADERADDNCWEMVGKWLIMVNITGFTKKSYT